MSIESPKDRFSRLADEVHAQRQIAENCLRDCVQHWDSFKTEHQEAILGTLEVLEFELKKARAYRGLRELVDLARETAD